MTDHGMDQGQGQDQDLQILFDLSGDLNWTSEFSEAYKALLFNRVKANNDKRTAFKMRQILINQIEFALNEFKNRRATMDMVLSINCNDFNDTPPLKSLGSIEK
jgi:hypothetical protein